MALVRVDQFLARLILSGRIGVDRDVKVGFTVRTALFSALCMRSCRFVDVRQLNRRFVALTLLLVLVFVLGRTNHVVQRLRRNPAGHQQRHDEQHQQDEQCADGRERPLEQDVQTAAQQTAGRAFHAGREQTAERAHGQVVLICTRKGVNDTADQQRHERDTRSAQTHRTLGTRKQQHGDADQRKRHDIRALADERTDAAVQPLEQHAVDRQDRQQAQQTDNAPDRAPDRTGQDRTEFLRLRLCRTLALGCAFRRFFSCGFPCSQNFYPSTFFVIQSDGVLRRFSAFCGYSASIL